MRIRVTLSGAVQGVGFRPFVYRLARELGLTGWVLNSSGGLEIEVEGDREETDNFLKRLILEKPRPAVVLTSEVSQLAPAGYTSFSIRNSEENNDRTTSILPDLATCLQCLEEISDAANRRHGYPFTNCTLCGPRYTIIDGIPYDRPNTTMRDFTLCAECGREYADPTNRRFHAQPNACPRCGPSLTLSLPDAARVLERGEILALKGIGGFQLLVDARNADAVQRLRERKGREEKPFALMMPSVEAARQWCQISEAEEKALCSSAAPIVLVQPNGTVGLAPNAARSSPFLGIMLPYSPLHHLLMMIFPYPVVATSGNRGDEPIAIDNEEASERLAGIADVVMTHNRPVARPCDDSVVRVARGGVSLIRRARGFAPLPVRVSKQLPRVLAVGAHLKNTVGIAVGRQVFLSQHIGDLETREARRGFERAIEDLCRLYRFEPQVVACDLHPDYASTMWARASGLPLIAVQHHCAHVAACAAENDVTEPYLGVAWDGAGFGTDGTIWGGEFFHVDDTGFNRVAHLRAFRLPGGEAAIRDTSRGAASLRFECGLEPNCPPVIHRMLERGVNCPLTTSVGRLFDAIAALTGCARENRFEGQAPMMLEASIGATCDDSAYSLPEGDWEPMVRAVLSDIERGVTIPTISVRFHNALANWIVETARESGMADIVLSGGVFQNCYLTNRTVELLEVDGFRVHTHQRIPPNDGGIALGQAVLADAPEYAAGPPE